MSTDISSNEAVKAIYAKEREHVSRLLANAEARATSLEKQAKSVNAARDLAVAYRDELRARSEALEADIEREFETLD